MSRVMTVLGIVFLAIGAAIAIVGFMNPGQMQVKGLTMDAAALMLMAGLVGMGLGGIIEAIGKRGGMAAVATPEMVEVAHEEKPMALPEIKRTEAPSPAPTSAEAPEPAAASEEQPSRIRFRGFGRKLGLDTPATSTTTAVAAAATAVAASAAAAAPKSTVDDTINALEKAKQDIASALGGVERMTSPSPQTLAPPPPPPVIADSEPDDVEEPEVVEEEATVDDGELYVVEEKIIRGRPARILSDDTVEAETDEGWMRFENLEHLNEYLDAAEA